jgi:hypothetical protein
MPIVLDYNSVNALGSLAVQAGEASRDRFNQQLLQQYDAQRNRTAAQLQGIEADERQAGANRQFQAQQANLDRQFRGQQAAQDRQFTATQQQREIAADQQRYNQQAQLSALDREARMQQAMMQAGLDVQQDQMDHQRAIAMQDRRHQQRLQEIAAREAYGAGGTADPASFEDRADAEVQEFADRIPINTTDPAFARQDQEQKYEQARSLSMLPTERLRELLQNDPQGEFARYIQGVLQQREGAAPRGSGAAAGRRRQPATPARRGGLAQERQGYGDTGLANISTQDLEKLANNPDMLERYLQQQGQQQGRR